MPAYRTPGVTFERPRPLPAVRRLPTDVAGFVGIARSGPLHHPVRVTSWPEFTARFGAHAPQGYLAYAVEGFFANGGRACWVVRVADPGTARPAALELAVGGKSYWRLVATSPGRWAHRLSVTVVGTAPGRCTLILRAPGTGQELWPDVDLLERSVEPVLNDRQSGSRLVRVCLVGEPPASVCVCPPGGPPAPRLEVVEGLIRAARPEGGADGLAALTPEHFLASGVAPPPDDPCAPPLFDRPWGLAALAGVDEVSLVAMPDAVGRPPVEERFRPRPRRCDVLPDDAAGAPVPPEPPPAPPEEPPERPPLFTAAQVARLQRGLIAHCEELGDRVALLDVPPARAGGGDLPQEVLDWRGGLTSRWAAAYWPWLAVPERLDTGDLLALVPPSGHVAGAIAASDLRVGVHKPPANDPLAGVEDLGFAVDDTLHGSLNDAGVNVLRAQPGRGIRVLGARTLDRDPLHRYLNVRRLLAFLVESIEERTGWTVFEPHDRRLRRQVDRVVRSFLSGLWRDGMLDGARPEHAFQVVCDESVNPPAEAEAGRLICEIAVRPPWPAEFVIARIGIAAGGVELIEDGGTGGGGDA